jgi:hypothetical protein
LKYRSLWNPSNLMSLFEGMIFSATLLFITSGLRIINPNNVGWLSFGDGTMEISWEFFRKQPVLQFPIGLNPKYGLEVSSTLAFDGQLPIMSLLLHPLSNFLPERFQYVGIYLLITFALNYYFAKKIFLELKLNHLNSSIASIILSSSPIILNRIIENTHYGLTSSFIIFIAFLLVIRQDSNYLRWSTIYLLSILIFLYYWPMIFIIHIIFMANRILEKIESLKSATLKMVFILFSSYFTMYVIGYIGQGVSSKDVGYGLFRSTLSSLIDPSGWSSILPDLQEPDGAYEGFAYLGLPAFILFSIFVTVKFFTKNLVKNTNISFRNLWLASIILFIFALSNKISFGTLELISFNVPSPLQIFTTSFRSSGRFSWPLVYLFSIWVIYLLSKRISSKTLTLFLLAVLSLHILDTYPQLKSQRNVKFSSEYRSNLTESGWKAINDCYSKIRVYPPTVGVNGYYDFANLAEEEGLSINTGRFGRVNQNAILGAYDLMHREFNTGIYREDSFYLFTEAEFVLPEIVNYQSNLAIHTLDDDSAHGILNNYKFIAPNLKNCSKGNALKQSAQGFGAPKTQIYRGEKLIFGKNFDTSKYILIGFSALEDWGVWSVDQLSKINFNTENLSNFKSININARDLATPANEFSVSLNDLIIGTCYFTTEFSTCTLPFDFKSLETNILTLSFVPKIIRSPKDLGISEDTRNLGFGMKSISFN